MDRPQRTRSAPVILLGAHFDGLRERVGRMSPRVAMVMRAFRVPLDLWEQADAISKVRGEYLSEVIRAALIAYVKRYGKDLK